VTHGFDAAKAVEAKWTPKLDLWLGAKYVVTPATDAQEWTGIDRVLTARHHAASGSRTIEYKCDELAAQTGNAFIEITSNDVTGRDGWARSCSADWILYYVTPDEAILLRPDAVRGQLDAWEGTSRIAKADNGDYRTLGLLVRLEDVRAVAEAVLAVPGDQPPDLWPAVGDCTHQGGRWNRGPGHFVCADCEELCEVVPPACRHEAVYYRRDEDDVRCGDCGATFKRRAVRKR